MTKNPEDSQQTPPESQEIPPAAEPEIDAEVLITVDHVYLPFDEEGKNVRTDWAVTSVSTTRVSRGTRLRVPTDLALYLDKRKQAEIL
jgi:hypothetical protein